MKADQQEVKQCVDVQLLLLWQECDVNTVPDGLFFIMCCCLHSSHSLIKLKACW